MCMCVSACVREWRCQQRPHMPNPLEMGLIDSCESHVMGARNWTQVPWSASVLSHWAMALILHPAFLHGFWGLNSGLCACEASTLFTEPCHWHQRDFSQHWNCRSITNEGICDMRIVWIFSPGRGRKSQPPEMSAPSLACQSGHHRSRSSQLLWVAL